jgi:septal ring factor EnvC (AmiA/AmiB activator)
VGTYAEVVLAVMAVLSGLVSVVALAIVQKYRTESLEQATSKIEKAMQAETREVTKRLEEQTKELQTMTVVVRVALAEQAIVNKVTSDALKQLNDRVAQIESAGH